MTAGAAQRPDPAPRRRPRARWWVGSGAAPALVLGAGQRGLQTTGCLPVRRRTSGGGAVLDGPWLLTAALWLGPGHPLAGASPVAAATWFGAVHAAWLTERGIGGTRLYQGPTQGHWACFAGRGPGEVLVGMRKIVGIAQVRRRGGVLLVAGTLLEPPPWELLCLALRRPAAAAQEIAAGTWSIRSSLGRGPTPAGWAASLAARIATALDLHQ